MQFATPLAGSGRRFVSSFTGCILVTLLRVGYKLYTEQTSHLYGKGPMANICATWAQARVLQTQSEGELQHLV